MDAEVGIEVGDDDAARVHPPLAHEQPIQVLAAPCHGAALADDDARLERIEDVDEVREGVAELLAQDADVLDAALVGLPRDDRDDLALRRPARLGQRPHRVPQLLERLGVGRMRAR